MHACRSAHQHHFCGNELEWTGKFKYLSSQFNMGSAGSLETELTRRMQQATPGFQQWSSSLRRQKCVYMGVEMQVYRTMVSQVLFMARTAGILLRDSWGCKQLLLATAGSWEEAKAIVEAYFRRLEASAAMGGRFHTECISVKS
jgi:hypothetical protein